MQQQQRGLFGIAGLAIEHLDIADGDRPIMRSPDRRPSISKSCPAERWLQGLRRKTRDAWEYPWLEIGGRLLKSPNLRPIIYRPRQSPNNWIYYLENRENEIEPDQRSSGLCRRRRESQPDKRRAPARPVAAIRQPLAGGHRAGRRRRADTPDDAPSNPTEAGLAYYQRLKTALEDIEEAKLQVSDRRLEPSGLLRISGPTGFAALHLVPATAAFLKIHPKIEVEVSTYDRYVDLVEDNLDLAVHIGPLPELRWPRPSVLPTSGGCSLPHPATSPNTAGRNTRRIFQSINASCARRGSARISGRSRWTARSGRSRYPGAFAPTAPASSTKRQFKALELPSRRFGKSGHWSIEASSK